MAGGNFEVDVLKQAECFLALLDDELDILKL